MLTYHKRASYCQHPLAKRLFLLMERKQTNLSVAVDKVTKAELIELADKLGPEICILKTHIDIIVDFDQDLLLQLAQLAKRHDFIIFEDRKFADIGNTVSLQYGQGVYRIAEWAPLTNAHVISGPGIIEGLKEVGLPRGNALLLLAQMSSKDNLAITDYTQQAIQLAHRYPEFVIGFIARQQLVNQPQWIHLVPGINFRASADNLGQQYLTPEQAILELKNDIIIVGRGIYEADDPQKEAQRYRQAGWQAYLKRCIAFTT